MSEEKSDNCERDGTTFNAMTLDMSDVLREKVAELQKKLYKGQQTVREGEQVTNDDSQVQDLNYCEQAVSLKKNYGRDSFDEIVPVRDMPLKKVS